MKRTPTKIVKCSYFSAYEFC